MSHATSRFLLLSALLALSGAVVAHDPPAATPTADVADPAAAPVLAVVDEFSTALQGGDLERAGALLATDVLILESGGAERSRAEYLEHHAISDAEFLKAAHVQRTGRTVRVHGDVAWVGSEAEIHASSQGQPLTLLSTETMVLRKEADGWRIVHIHWSSRPKK